MPWTSPALSAATRCGVVLDVADDGPLDAGLLPPVVGVRLEHDLLVRLPLDELEGARAHRVLAVVRAPLLDGLRAGDVEGEHRDVLEERRLRLPERELHGVVPVASTLSIDRLVVEAVELALEVLEGLPRLELVLVLRVLGASIQRSKFQTTAFASNGSPSWNFTFLRSLSVHTLPSAEASAFSASAGWTAVVPGLNSRGRRRSAA